MLFNELALQIVKTTPIIYIEGGWGNYKTLLSVALARYLLKSGHRRQLLCNFPCIFASSPIVNPDKFQFGADETIDSVIIIDEAWLELGNFDRGKLEAFFSFPRKLNQTIILPTAQKLDRIDMYSPCIIYLERDFSTFGIPLIWYKCFLHGTPRKDAQKLFLFNPPSYYYKYSSHFRPDNGKPIRQFMDTGALYDINSRLIPQQIQHLYQLNSWGLCEPLPDKVLEKIEPVKIWSRKSQRWYYIPAIKAANDFSPKFVPPPQLTHNYPLPKRKFSFKTFFSTTFNIALWLRLGVLLWIMIATLFYAYSMTASSPRPWKRPDLFLRLIPSYEWNKHPEVMPGWATDYYNKAKDSFSYYYYYYNEETNELVGEQINKSVSPIKWRIKDDKND